MEKILEDSPCYEMFSRGLKEYLSAERFAESKSVFVEPEIVDDVKSYKPKTHFHCKPSDVRLPSRLSSALIPYPEILKQHIKHIPEDKINTIHGHHYSQLRNLCIEKDRLISMGVVPDAPVKYSINTLKPFSSQSYSYKESLINMGALSFAKRATSHEMSICAQEQMKNSITVNTISEYTPFLIMIQRLRVHIAKSKEPVNWEDVRSQFDGIDANYAMTSSGTYLYGQKSEGRTFFILSCGGHFQIYHSSLGYWFAGPSTYLDYIFTLSDIMNNLDVIRNAPEYDWSHSCLEVMIEFAEFHADHNDQVNFIKSIEGLFLNLSDYDTNFAMNWKPLIEALEELWTLDQKICDIKYSPTLLFLMLDKVPVQIPTRSFLCRLIHRALKLTRTQQQELSSLHRLIFYAEVDAKAGVTKFLKRVHTKRKVDSNSIQNLTRLAKQLFFKSYVERHSIPPNMLGNKDKIQLLQTSDRKRLLVQLENYPLTWWDDVRIVNCMDNTLTDDPLEYAKDKGALKNKISFGPGDSRKELLQVIESVDYKLEDFFSRVTLKPLEPKICRTTMRMEPLFDIMCARLIEKEREQKVEARLFGNAELANKHALSLVTARMKKALSYFDEQLMTPSDKARKYIIHEASRELTQADNYSLLLDIEGHNQSMQYENTSELCQFIGDLFGESSWSELPNYFSALTVYHYDEYMDDVLTSQGQYGGIEGWLNPLWTLHTTLMMKLLRMMTDITVKTIMVYSDDVNAIISIPQASESAVKSVFSKILVHCSKFGMTVKYSQTNISKHRISMLRQHYADGVRADSTLKRLISISSANNPMIVSEEIEVAGICSSAASAMELSNHSMTCSYLKNYKLGILLSRLPQMILSHPQDRSMISTEMLPTSLANILYYIKDDASEVNLVRQPQLKSGFFNDIRSYLRLTGSEMNEALYRTASKAIYGTPLAESRMVDQPDRMLYLQIYDNFLMDLLFYWIYLPTSMGGLGGALHINLVLSGHSVGTSKAVHYLKEWIVNYSCNVDYFINYLGTVLTIDEQKPMNYKASRVVTSNWPSDMLITPAMSSLKQSIKAMVRQRTRNRRIKKLFELSDFAHDLASDIAEVFKHNMHTRIAQFYYENSAVHFCDLLLNKVESSSGLLIKVKDILKLRRSLSIRTIENIRRSANRTRTSYCSITKDCDLIEELSIRKQNMFPELKFIPVEEILYDDKLRETISKNPLITVRRCSPVHYRNGIKVFDDAKVGSEVLYKGELTDDDRLLTHKEELLAAKNTAITKWLLMKNNLFQGGPDHINKLDCVIACNLALSTLTNQTFLELCPYSPTEVGGEVLHRIPNMRFMTNTYLRSDMNRSLNYTTDLNQNMITQLGLVDSNINFDYIRMRVLLIALTKDKSDDTRRIIIKYELRNYIGIKDVQFVTPKISEYKLPNKIMTYSNIVHHDLSMMRFRYLAGAYLYSEDLRDLNFIPETMTIDDISMVAYRYINDLILRYARNLDKEYMTINMTHIDIRLWQPLIDKLVVIDKEWRVHPEVEVLEELSIRLAEELNKRCNLRITSKEESSKMMMKKAIIEETRSRSPEDIELFILSDMYGQILKHQRPSSNFNKRLAQYSNMLLTVNEHRYKLAKYLIIEYIVYFHLSYNNTSSILTADCLTSMNHYVESENIGMSFFLINPDLQVRMTILGLDYINRIARTYTYEIYQEFIEICDDISMVDIITPEGLPSLASHTTLSGSECLPEAVSGIEYIMEKLPNSALAQMELLEPVMNYIYKCTMTGSHPSSFISHTGSDSLGAQYALMKMLMDKDIINQDMAICDLTGGRGDGLYAMNYLGLKSKTYSKKDTFTSVNHHPQIDFTTEYDVFKGSTLKFLDNFDFVHVDISFTGSQENDISDLVMLLESRMLPYSIRINSVSLKKFSTRKQSRLPSYTHHLAYACSSIMKPYHVYLIGVPADNPVEERIIDMKDSIAFRSIIFGFSKLLNKDPANSKLSEFEPNSNSIYLPAGNDLVDYIKSMISKSVEHEQSYYCNKYISEVTDGGMIQFIPQCMPDGIDHFLKTHVDYIRSSETWLWNNLQKNTIGRISEKSRPFHERHLAGLNSRDPRIVEIYLSDCDGDFLSFLRSHHPVGFVRSQCNIFIGLWKFCYGTMLSGHEAVCALAMKLRTENKVKETLHHREVQMAMKIMVLAESRDDYSYGIRHIHRLITLSGKGSKSMMRVLKIYRHLSYLFDEISSIRKSGLITIKMIEVIENELVKREVMKYKYKQKETHQYQSNPVGGDTMLDIEFSLDKIFSGMENMIIKGGDKEHQTEEAHPMSMDYDIDISKTIDDAIERLGLRPTGRHGIIDLGDDFEYYDGD